MVFGIIAATLVLSGVVGYGVFRGLHKARPWLRVTLSILAAAFFSALGAGVFSILGLTPAVDEPVGVARRIPVWIARSSGESLPPSSSLGPPPSSPDSRRGADRLPPRDALGRVEILAPSSVAPNEDFVLGVSLISTGVMPTGEYRVSLLAPASAQLRTLSMCDGGPGPFAACAESRGNIFEVTWGVTPTEPGVLLFTLALPRELMPHEGVENWTAFSPAGSSGGPSVRSNSASQVIAREGVSIDLRNNQVRASVTVISTLGVTRVTFNVLAVLGTALSAALGSGWLWQALGWWRKRRRSRARVKLT
jgi:hypothetical protein